MAIIILMIIVVLVTLIAAGAHSLANDNADRLSDMNWRVSQMRSDILRLETALAKSADTKKPRSA